MRELLIEGLKAMRRQCMRESGWNNENVAEWRREGEGVDGVESLPPMRVVLVGRCGWRVL